jgi:hypothetical protein
MSDYRVTLGGKKRYNIGVNYEVPSKSIQYTNLILDNISIFFDGIRQSFPITVNGESYTPYNPQQLLIYINGEILESEKDYTVSGSQIYFFNAPNIEDYFYGIALVTTADLTRTINYEIDSGSFDMEPGIKGQITLDVSGTIESWTIISETPGNLILDIKKTSYLDYPNNLVSITGTERPHLGILNQFQQQKNKDDDLTTWNRILNAGDVLQYEVIAVSHIRRFLIALKLRL